MTALVRRTSGLLRLCGMFAFELVISSLRVAWDVVTPRHLSRPGILAVPLDAKTDVEITVFANLLCLTPGTLSLAVSEDRRVLYVHAMFIEHPEEDCGHLKRTFERRVLEALR